MRPCLRAAFGQVRCGTVGGVRNGHDPFIVWLAGIRGDGQTLNGRGAEETASCAPAIQIPQVPDTKSPGPLRDRRSVRGDSS